MEKATITSIKKGPKINEYIFKKNQNFVELIDSFLIDLNIQDYAYKHIYYTFKNMLSFEEGSPKKKIKKSLQIRKIKDEIYHFNDKNYDINIFIGDKKIILVIRTKKDKQQEISKKISKIAGLIKK